MSMDTLQYEAIKVAMKQDKEGFILTLRVHPDEVPEALLRDFVGARYQTVMVRIGDDEKPLNRDNFSEVVKLAGMLPRNPDFREWLVMKGHIWSEEDEEESSEEDDDHLYTLDHYDEDNLPEYACRYCGIHDPACVAHCVETK